MYVYKQKNECGLLNGKLMKITKRAGRKDEKRSTESFFVNWLQRCVIAYNAAYSVSPLSLSLHEKV